MDLEDRVRDSLPVNQPYDGLVAQAYDCWLPHDADYGDLEMYRRAIEQGDGPALELGCGNGRLLLRYRMAGLDVDGVDSAADMLAICRAHADAAGLTVTLHCGDWATIDLPRRYATIYNPAGSFMLIDSDAHAGTTLSTWMRHLAPGGQLWVAMGIPRARLRCPVGVAGATKRNRALPTASRSWCTRRSRATSTCRSQHVLNRHEVWDANGQLVTTFVRRHRLRWWTADQLERMLRDCGATKGSRARHRRRVRRGGVRRLIS